MTFSELMSAVRSSYVEVLADTTRSCDDFRREPVLRRADGRPALEDDQGLPVRVDAIGDGGESLRVDATHQLRFDRFSFSLNGATVSVSPFTWDWLVVEVSGDALVAGDVFRRWFMRWFDSNDERTPGADGLRGVVHFMSDIQPTDEGVAVQIDLGSCPDEALDDLLFSLSEGGAVEVHLGA